MGLLLDLHFDIAAMTVMVVILTFLSFKKNIPVKRSYVFMILCILQVLVIVCSMGMQLSIQSDLDYAEKMGMWFADCYFALDYLCAFIFMYYMVLWSGKSIHGKIKAQLSLMIPFIFYIAMIIDNFIRHNLYTLDKSNGLIYNNRLKLLSVVTLYAMLFGICYAIKYVEAISYGKLTAITIGCAGVVIGLLLQFRFQGTYFFNFVFTIMYLLMYEIAQNPLNILDGNTQVLNRLIMDEMLNVDISENKEELKISYSTISGSIELINDFLNENVSLDTFMAGRAEKTIYARIKGILSEQLYAKFKGTRQNDSERGITGIGIHKDDLDISLNGLSMKVYSSQGQQRSASLSLKLSELDIIRDFCRTAPILLLDDVFSELDVKRRVSLISGMVDAQIFITCTEKEYIEKELKMLVGGSSLPRYFHVEEGKVTPE